MRQQKGFTFIELIIAIAIMAIIAGTALPAYFKLKPAMQINGAAREIMGDLMWARMKAVSENNDYVVTFATATNSYNIYDDDNNSFKTTYVAEANELVKTVNIADEFEGIEYGFVPGMKHKSGIIIAGSKTVTFKPASGQVWFRFRSSGRSNKNGSIYIIPGKDKDVGREDRTRVITTIMTGNVTIKQYNPVTQKWD